VKKHLKKTQANKTYVIHPYMYIVQCQKIVLNINMQGNRERRLIAICHASFKWWWQR